MSEPLYRVEHPVSSANPRPGTERVLLITGSRVVYPEYLSAVTRVFGDIGQPTPSMVIHGACPDPKFPDAPIRSRSVDVLADDWWGDTCVPVPAQWRRYGKKAGSLRNLVLLRLALREVGRGSDVEVHALPGPRSVGTLHMVRVAEAAGLPVTVHRVLLPGGGVNPG